jgi:hypothetical protein
MATVVDALRALQAAGKGPAGGARVEACVHGALCVAYSGQCLSSEAWGGRSANRGQCAQACRLPYGLVVDGALVELLDDAAYLLSPQVCAQNMYQEAVFGRFNVYKSSIHAVIGAVRYACLTLLDRIQFQLPLTFFLKYLQLCDSRL